MKLWFKKFKRNLRRDNLLLHTKRNVIRLDYDREVTQLSSSTGFNFSIKLPYIQSIGFHINLNFDEYDKSFELSFKFAGKNLFYGFDLDRDYSDTYLYDQEGDPIEDITIWEKIKQDTFKNEGVA